MDDSSICKIKGFGTISDAILQNEFDLRKVSLRSNRIIRPKTGGQIKNKIQVKKLSIDPKLFDNLRKVESVREENIGLLNSKHRRQSAFEQDSEETKDGLRSNQLASSNLKLNFESTRKNSERNSTERTSTGLAKIVNRVPAEQI
jgi:hypothetical protein